MVRYIKSSPDDRKHSVHSSKKIVCSIPQDDVVMYYYGKRIYMGGPGDLYDTILSLCKDDEVRFGFQEWCEHFGYTLSDDKSGTAEEISNLFCDIVYQLCTDDPYGVITGDGILDFEIFPVSYDTI